MLQSERELINTRAKLRLLEESYDRLRNQSGGDKELREASMKSLQHFINQLKEEIARYEAHQPARR
jgi:flagellar biosynthesis chaperone FliJ